MQTNTRKRNRVIRALLAFILTASMLGGLAAPALAAAPEAEEPENVAVQAELDNPENLETVDTETAVPDDTEDTQDTVFLERDTNAPPTYTVVNGGFETGDLTGWTLLNGEPADNNNVGVVSSETIYWPEMPTRYFYQAGEYFLLGNSKEGTTGAIRSSDFTLGGDGYISFLIGGASTESKGSVKLYQANEGGEDTLVKTYTNPEWKDPAKGMTLIRKYDKLSDYIGKQLYFVVENGTDTGGFAFINADDFRTSLTLNEVKELHKSEMERIQTIDDKYKNEIIDSYKNYGLAEADYAALVSTIPETITRYAGNTVELAELIRSFTKVEMAYGRKPVDFTVRITDADYNGELTLSEGTYTVKYAKNRKFLEPLRFKEFLWSWWGDSNT